MNRTKYQLVSIFLIIVIASQVIAYNNIAQTESESHEGGNFMMVELEHRNSEGELLDKRCIKDDLILRNMAYWMAVQGGGTDYVEAQTTYRAKKTDGALVSHTNARIDFLATIASVYIGTGTTAPAVTDYALETSVMDELVVDRLYWNSGTQFNVTVDSLFLIDGTYAITEIGLSAGLEGGQVLMARDTFTAINVVAGDTLTTRYFFLANWSG